MLRQRRCRLREDVLSGCERLVALVAQQHVLERELASPTITATAGPERERGHLPVAVDQLLEQEEKRLASVTLQDLIKPHKSHPRPLCEVAEKLRIETEEKRRALEEEKAAMEGAHTFQKNWIKLNVGGHRFETSLQTLTSVPDTYFSSFFSGRFELKPNQDNEYYIDRDGRLFNHVLNFLRDKDSFAASISGLTMTERRELEVEARFYGLFDSIDDDATREQIEATAEDAAAASLSRLEGAFALCFLFEGEEDLIVAARRGSPLAIGYGENEMLFNDGNGRFKRMWRGPGADVPGSTGACCTSTSYASGAADFNSDGRLELYVLNKQMDDMGGELHYVFLRYLQVLTYFMPIALSVQGARIYQAFNRTQAWDVEDELVACDDGNCHNSDHFFRFYLTPEDADITATTYL